MAYITKRGNSYSVRYTYEDEHGKSCDKWESFPTKEEATNRKKQIEHELAAGTFSSSSSGISTGIKYSFVFSVKLPSAST